MNVLKEAGLLPPRINPDNIEKMSIEAGCDVKAEDAHKEILESVNQGIFSLSTQSPSSELKHDHEDKVRSTLYQHRPTNQPVALE